VELKGKSSARNDALGRRSFFRTMVSETIALFDELHGKPQFRLADLWELPDDMLAQIMPVVLPDVEIIVTEQHVSARRQDKDEINPLFDCEPANMFVFNRFNGQATIGQIGKELAAEMSWDEEEGFVYAKNLFLQLVRMRVCVPSNPIG